MALEREPVPRQPEITELRRELRDRRHLGLILELLIVQRNLRSGVRQRRIRIGRDQQEGLRPEPARADAGDLGEQLISAEAQRADDARGERVLGEVTGWVLHQFFSSPPMMPPIASPPELEELPPDSCTGGW